jgi:hypothetical protein
MKGEPKSYEMALQPLPQVIVSVRDKEGRNNALAILVPNPGGMAISLQHLI